jgi:hypothetical protein
MTGYETISIIISAIALIWTAVTFILGRLDKRKNDVREAVFRAGRIVIHQPQNRTLLGCDRVSFDVTIVNGSDMAVRHVTLKTPEELTEISQDADHRFSVGNDGRLDTVILGDIAPNDRKTAGIVMRNTPSSIGEFVLTFQDYRGDYWRTSTEAGPIKESK